MTTTFTDWPVAGLAEPITGDIQSAIRDLPGWPHPMKEKHLAHLILQLKPQLVVEIGVYGGRSFIPQAMALKHNKSGFIYGIDPWDSEAVKRNAAENEDWFPGQEHMDEAYGNLNVMLKLYELE